MRNLVWNIQIAYAVFKKKITESKIYMRDIVWNIDFCKSLKHS